MATIGELIVDARRAKDMTRDELARAMSVPGSTLSHWESDRAVPDADALLRLSELLDCSFESATAKSDRVLAARGHGAVAPSGSPEGGVKAEPAAPGEALEANAGISRPEPKRPAKGKWILVGAAAVVLLCAALVVVLPIVVHGPENPTAATEKKDVSRLSKAYFQQPNPEADGKAHLALDCALEAGKKDGLDVWRYTLSARERHGFAFAVDRVEIYTFVSSGVEERRMGSQTLENGGVSVDVAAYGDWSVTGDLPVQNTASGIGFVICGTDESGAELSFAVYQALD